MKPRVRSGWLIFSLAAAPYFYFAAAQTPAAKVGFAKDIAPIFKAHCESCHSGSSPADGLDLSSVKGIEKGGSSGKLFVSGDPANSVLIKRVTATGGERMPMNMPALADADIAKLKAWVAEGGKFDRGGATHWSYVAPVRPKVPALNSSWVRNPIDAFVLQRLKKEGLRASPGASKETLIRRVSIDLTGLPPTPAEVDAFLADKSPKAYEKVVDRLLASPHYGERQAREWLDLARYADSDGFEKDLNRTAWMYRDWVIDAFNRNMPYDQFTIKQLAGDLLPNATLMDKVATGFNRNTMFNREGGVDAAETHFNVLTDRVDTTATVWLGSTLQCSRCHDHKYDPFTQRDYYGLVAFFNNSVYEPRGSKEKADEEWFEPQIPAPTAAQTAMLAELSTRLAGLQQRDPLSTPELRAAYEDWKRAALQPIQWNTLVPVTATAASGAKLITGTDGSIAVSGPNPKNDTYTLTFKNGSQYGGVGVGEAPRGIRIEALTDPSLGHRGPGRSEAGNFVLTKAKFLIDGKQVLPLQQVADFYEPRFDPSQIFADGGSNPGWSIWPQVGNAHELWIDLNPPKIVPSEIAIELAFNSQFDQHQFGKFRISATSFADPCALLLTPKIADLLKKPNRDGKEEAELQTFFLSRTRLLVDVRNLIVATQRETQSVKDSIATAMVLQEKPGNAPLTEWVRHRGEFTNKSEQVTANTPAVLPPLKAARANRLDLARWLVSPSNPLTARVEVNRIWEQYFGRGIVETSEDFGTRGSPPTHPQLLDWLSCEFMARGWDMKAMNRLIVTSSTYRQASASTPALEAKDPQNQLYAHGPRFRMDAEAIHDTILSASGLLSLKIGGPSVFPYQPTGVWDTPASGERWTPSTGEDRFRRGIYTFAKRTSPYPAFLGLDATSREVCTARRIRTNTPLQALELLNDQLMIEAARALGRRMEAAGKSDASRISAGFQLCAARKPKPQELQRLAALLAKEKIHYATRPKEAKELGGNADDAAFTVMGNVLLNLDETITKE